MPVPEDSLRSIDHRVAVLEEKVRHLETVVEPRIPLNNICSVVAGVVLKEREQHTSSGRFFSMLDSGECLLKYSAALALGCASSVSEHMRTEIYKALERKLTLGSLAAQLRTVLDRENIDNWALRILRSVFRRENGKQTDVSRYLLEEFVTLRNRERGHAAHQPEGHYEDLFLRHQPTVENCLVEGKHLSIPLIHIRAVDNEGDLSSYQVTELMGPNPAIKSSPILSPVRVPRDSTCLWDGGTQFIPVTDFIAYRYCPICNQEHVFLSENIMPRKIEYHSYVGNHRQVVDRPMVRG